MHFERGRYRGTMKFEFFQTLVQATQFKGKKKIADGFLIPRF